MSRLEEIEALAAEWRESLTTAPQLKHHRLLLLVAEELVEHKHRLAGMGFMTGEPI